MWHHSKLEHCRQQCQHKNYFLWQQQHQEKSANIRKKLEKYENGCRENSMVRNEAQVQKKEEEMIQKKPLKNEENLKKEFE